MTDLRIRTAREEDIGDMVRLQRESLPDTYGPFLADESLGPWIEDDGVERYVASAWPNMLLAESECEILGFASIAGALIDLLWVRADVRSQGIGSRLMDHAEPRSLGTRPPSSSASSRTRAPCASTNSAATTSRDAIWIRRPASPRS
jgi:GNAT superfamily N-acetyltransferase